MKGFLPALLIFTAVSSGGPRIKVTAQLTGSAAAEAKAFAALKGERYPFPVTFTLKSGGDGMVELGKEMKIPTTAKGDKLEGRFIGTILRIEPKLDEGSVAFEGSFHCIRLGAMARHPGDMSAPSPYSEWTSYFKGTAEPGKKITIDLSKEPGSPASLELVFALAEEPAIDP
jgi:hypothetical protein